MQEIIIVGELTGGYGGMEIAFRRFYHLLEATGKYRVKLLFARALKPEHDYAWLKDLNHSFAKAPVKGRLPEMLAAAKLLRKAVKEGNVAGIVCYGQIGVQTARLAMLGLRQKALVYSWMHFSLHRLKPKNQKIMAGCDFHLAICDEIAEQLQNAGASNDTISVIHNPIRRQHAAINRPENSSPAQFLYTGRIDFDGQKNMQELLHGLSALSLPFQLHIIGKGPAEKEQKLKALAQELCIAESLIWHGWQQEPWQYVQQRLPAVTALVMTSSYEGFGLVLAEAMALGIPCVSSACPTGPKSIIQQGVNGWLYGCGDVAGLTAALEKAVRAPLTDTDAIKRSIEPFYEDNYQANVAAVFAANAPAR